MMFDITANELFSYDFKKMEANFSEKFTNIVQVLASFPLNIPGTTFYKCLKVILILFLFFFFFFLWISTTFRFTGKLVLSDIDLRIIIKKT